MPRFAPGIPSLGSTKGQAPRCLSYSPLDGFSHPAGQQLAARFVRLCTLILSLQFSLAQSCMGQAPHATGTAPVRMTGLVGYLHAVAFSPGRNEAGAYPMTPIAS